MALIEREEFQAARNLWIKRVESRFDDLHSGACSLDEQHVVQLGEQEHDAVAIFDHIARKVACRFVHIGNLDPTTKTLRSAVKRALNDEFGGLGDYVHAKADIKAVTLNPYCGNLFAVKPQMFSITVVMDENPELKRTS